MTKEALGPYHEIIPGEGAVQTRVLVVDDDEEMTELLKILLEPNGFEVLTANCVDDGIELAKRAKPDVMVLDLVMPGMDGWQVCKEIRKHSQVPILVLSVINKPGMVARALDEGADDYLLKPVTSNILTAHLRRLVRRAQIEQGFSDARIGLGA